MGADFIATALWRRGESLDISDEEFAGVLDRIATMPGEMLNSRLADYMDVAQDEAMDEDDGVTDPAKVEQIVRNRLAQDVKWLKDALAGGDREVGMLHIGPYVVLLAAEMSWGDIGEAQEAMGRLADSEVLVPLGFGRPGYVGSVQTDTYGTVMSAIFEVIADRRDCKVEEVVTAANKAELYEDRIWEQAIGPAVDSIEDIMHDFLPEYA